jgi:hypothetical protein
LQWPWSPARISQATLPVSGSWGCTPKEILRIVLHIWCVVTSY